VTGAAEQVRRLLALVPYLQEREGVHVEQVAADFGVPTATIMRDLKVLWYCGLPGSMPGDLIEVDMEALDGEGVVHLDNADYLARPLRLDPQEAVALIVALRTLREVGGPEERDAVDRALSKLESAAGDSAGPAAHVEVKIEPSDPAIADTVNAALSANRRLHLTYYVPARDETTERDVDPMRIVVAAGQTYLEGWCYRADDTRLFRLDRIQAASMLAVPASPPPRASRRDLSGGLFQASPDDLLATLELSPMARWVADYYPMEGVEEAADGRLVVKLRAGDPQWLRRLVLRLGGEAKVIAPLELADQVRADAIAALAAYEVGTP
jgi:proteasome accessory factor C